MTIIEINHKPEINIKNATVSFTYDKKLEI